MPIFKAEQILVGGITVKFVVACGTLPGEERTIQIAEGLYIKSKDEPSFQIARSTVADYLEKGRMEELQLLRAKLLEPFLIQEKELVHLPFVTTLKLRAEAWTKAEPFLSSCLMEDFTNVI